MKQRRTSSKTMFRFVQTYNQTPGGQGSRNSPQTLESQEKTLQGAQGRRRAPLGSFLTPRKRKFTGGKQVHAGRGDWAIRARFWLSVSSRRRKEETAIKIAGLGVYIAFTGALDALMLALDTFGAHRTYTQRASKTCTITGRRPSDARLASGAARHAPGYTARTTLDALSAL